MKHGALRVDNNLTENSIHPFVVGRNNWFFAGTPQGTEPRAALYSLIETAKANSIEP
ncbi:transposase [Desulfobulbus rhabdoformis]|nr:transposase [Desulfobulbus rhabdoformis]